MSLWFKFKYDSETTYLVKMPKKDPWVTRQVQVLSEAILLKCLLQCLILSVERGGGLRRPPEKIKLKKNHLFDFA